MAEPYDIEIKMISLSGHCAREHKVGDTWIASGKTPAGICITAFNSIYPDLRVLRFGGTFPWSDDTDTVKGCCPDPKNNAVFEMRRIKK